MNPKLVLALLLPVACQVGCFSSATVLRTRGVELTSRSELAKKQAVELGVQSILLRSLRPADSGVEPAEVTRYGLLRDDHGELVNTLPMLRVAVPEREIETTAKIGDQEVAIQLVGGRPDSLASRNRKMAQGRFLSAADRRKLVAVVSFDLAKSMFPKQSAVGQSIQIRTETYQIAGVLDALSSESAAIQISLGRTFRRFTVFIPLSTMHSRIGDRTANKRGDRLTFDEVQLSEITLIVDKAANVDVVQQIVEKVMAKRHQQKDWSIIVPKRLLSEPVAAPGAIVMANFDKVSIKKEDFTMLQKLPDLEILLLDDAAISDADLTYLETMRKLKVASLRNTNVSERAIEKLQRARSGLQILR